MVKKNLFESLDAELNRCSNRTEYHYVFYHIAKLLMNEYYLKIDSFKIEFTDIEFYFFNCKNHRDFYIHLNELQSKVGYLYVHGSHIKRGGIDMTFGKENYLGSFLIRGIKHKNFFMSGPANIKNFFRKELNCKNDNDLQKLFDELKNENKILLCNKNNENYSVLLSTRVGLNSEIDDYFSKVLYRFIRKDYLNDKKTKNIKEKDRARAICNLIFDEKNMNM
jgi:hypothetical protein